MLHFSRFKTIAILLTCLAGFLVALPNFFTKEQLAAWPSFMSKHQMPIGLDLQGGAHLLLDMDQEEIKKDWFNNLRDSVRKSLRDERIGASAIGVQGGQMSVRLVKPEETETALKLLKKLAQPIGNAILGSAGMDMEVSQGSDPGTIILKPTEQGIRHRIAHAAEASIATLTRRVNALGTMIANGMSKAMNIPVEKSLLQRGVERQTQTRKHRYERFENMKDVFLHNDDE